jgi:hypothetical protein
VAQSGKPDTCVAQFVLRNPAWSGWYMDTEVTGEGKVAAKGLLVGTQVTAHLLLACVVDGTLLSGEIVGSREGVVARLSSKRVHRLGLVRSILLIFASTCVLSQFRCSFKSQCPAVVRRHVFRGVGK